MPRYYFDILDGRFLRDEEGQDCANDTVALRSAQQALGEMVQFREELWDDGRFVVEVLDAGRRRIARLTALAERFEAAGEEAEP